MELFDGATRHLPSKKIPSENLIYLGYVDSFDILLAIEEGQFKVYQYEYWNEEDIRDGGHESEDWRDDIDNYFGNGSGCFDIDTCECNVLKFNSDKPIKIAQELIDKCSEELQDMNYVIYDGESPSPDFISFISYGLIKIGKYNGTLVYQYYK